MRLRVGRVRAEFRVAEFWVIPNSITRPDLGSGCILHAAYFFAS